MFNSKLYAYSYVTAAATLVLIAAGGLVTSTGSGLSVPDWPLSYGQFFPPMIGGIRYEHSHRLIAASVGCLTFILSALLWRTETRRFMKVLALSASMVILLQAILGGLTVKYLLPKPISVSHACLGQSFFVLLCLISLFLSGEWRLPPKIVSGVATPFIRLAWTTAAFSYFQLVAGAVVRHTGGRGLIIHFFLAFFIVLHAIFLNQKMFKAPAVQRVFLSQIIWLDGLLVVQLFMGLGAYFFKYALEKGAVPGVPEILFTTVHQTCGALILANLFVLSFRASRFLVPDPVNPAHSEYLELVKVRLTLMALLATFAGFYLGSPGHMDLAKLLHTLLGAFMIGGGGNALNQFFERDIDLKMRRTKTRPLPSKKMTPKNVLVFGSLLVAAGIAEMLFFVSSLSAVVGFIIFFGYVFVYTPLKRITVLNTYAGAVPGALPLMLGWVSGGGSLGPEALSLFLILFLWQLPHFYAIAWVHREDYRNGGLKMLPERDASGRDTAFQILFFSILLVAASLLPFWLGLSGKVYLIAASVAGITLVMLAADLFRRNLSEARSFIYAALLYLLVILSFLVADKI